MSQAQLEMFPKILTFHPYTNPNKGETGVRLMSEVSKPRHRERNNMPKASQEAEELGFHLDSPALVSMFSATLLHCLSSMLNEDTIPEFTRKERSHHRVMNVFYFTMLNKCLLCV